MFKKSKTIIYFYQIMDDFDLEFAGKTIVLIWPPGCRDYSEDKIDEKREFPTRLLASQYLNQHWRRNSMMFTEKEYERRHNRMEISEFKRTNQELNMIANPPSPTSLRVKELQEENHRLKQVIRKCINLLEDALQ